MLLGLPFEFSSQPLSVYQLSFLSFLRVTGNMAVSSIQGCSTQLCRQTRPKKKQSQERILIAPPWVKGPFPEKSAMGMGWVA